MVQRLIVSRKDLTWLRHNAGRTVTFSWVLTPFHAAVSTDGVGNDYSVFTNRNKVKYLIRIA